MLTFGFDMVNYAANSALHSLSFGVLQTYGHCFLCIVFFRKQASDEDKSRVDAELVLEKQKFIVLWEDFQHSVSTFKKLTAESTLANILIRSCNKRHLQVNTSQSLDKV